MGENESLRRVDRFRGPRRAAPPDRARGPHAGRRARRDGRGQCGNSRLLATGLLPALQPTRRKLTWPNGAIALTYSSWQPDQLRGPAFDGAWCDELAAWKYPREAWDNLQFGLRLAPTPGGIPQVVVSTTPRPIPLLKELIADRTTLVTGGTSYDNLANLPESYVERNIHRYEGTRLGRQEIHAELLLDTPGALWTIETLERTRVKDLPALARIVVAVDPAVSSAEGAAETGIIVAGAVPAQRGRPPECFVLDDLTLRGTPHDWASAAVAAYKTFRADRIVAEANQGGEMVAATIHAVDPKVPVLLVRAMRGKYVRAEPVAALYEQGLIHHVGMFPELEDSLVTWVPGEASPDRLDALVWAVTALVEGKGLGTRSHMPDPAGLARPSAWAVGNEGLSRAVAPHLATDY